MSDAPPRTVSQVQEDDQPASPEVEGSAPTGAPPSSATVIAKQTEPDDFSYPTGLPLVLLLVSIYIGLFLVALDKLIISTATPAITNDFHAADDVGWYGTAYLLTNAAFLLVFGKLYTIFHVKAVFIAAVLLFECGSAVCGAAPNSIGFIVGRAIAGLGAGGVQAGVVTLIVYAVPLEKRPTYQGLFGAIYGVSSILGPVVGGAFTSNVSWRWCFYINLPFGGLVLLFVLAFLKAPGPSIQGGHKERMLQLNFEGLLALLPGVVSLCLALQWGGFTYSWSNWRVVLTLAFGLVLLVVFVLTQLLTPDRAIVPPRIVAQRSIASGLLLSFCLGAHQTLIIYYLSIWFQAVKGDSAVESGIHILPQVLALVVAAIGSGILSSKVGYYTPFVITGSCIAVVGAGLFLILNPQTTIGQWIGYQIAYGFGLGMALSAPTLAAQTVLRQEDVAIGSSLMLFANTLGGSIFVSVGQNVIVGELARSLARFTRISSQQIAQAGLTGLLEIVPGQNRTSLFQAYNAALRACFVIALAMACIAVLGALGLEWKNVKAHGDTAADTESDEKAQPRTDS